MGCRYELRLRQGLGAGLCEVEGLGYCGRRFLLPAAAAAAACAAAARFTTVLQGQQCMEEVGRECSVQVLQSDAHLVICGSVPNQHILLSALTASATDTGCAAIL
jgi:hypothetical protein